MKTVALFLLLHLTNGDYPMEPSAKVPGPEVQKPLEGEPPPKEEYVYVSPIFYENYVDPITGLKEPVDILEMRMVYPKTEEEKRYYLKNNRLRDVQFIDKSPAPAQYYDPRDELNRTRFERLPLFNFEALQSENLNKEPTPSQITYNNRTVLPMAYEPQDSIYNLNFAFAPDDVKITWTTCDEFKENALFHPKDLLNIDWVPFYIWATNRDEAYVAIHKFSIPTKKAVEAFRKEYGPYLSIKVNWNQPKLMLEDATPTLLIAADDRGLFYGIMDQKVSEYTKTHPKMKYPVLTIRMKIIDPYLAMMYCGDFYAQIMAIKGQVPETDELKREEAKVLNFTGKGFPVTMDQETEKMAREKAEWDRLQKQREEEAKHEAKVYDMKENSEIW